MSVAVHRALSLVSHWYMLSIVTLQKYHIASVKLKRHNPEVPISVKAFLSYIKWQWNFLRKVEICCTVLLRGMTFRWLQSLTTTTDGCPSGLPH